MRKLLLFLFCVIALCVGVVAQKVAVSGKVVDSTGAGIAGASIREKGVKNGVSADEGGSFKISVNSGATLIISAIGFGEASVSASSSMRVVLQASSVKDLSEVIVSGVAGATSKEKLTVSVTKIGADRLNAVPAMSASSALSGKVAGVRVASTGGLPGQSMDILLRADNNLNNVGSGPLIVVDGVQMSGSLADINSDDIESMEVIKGAAASALYGSRAGNGVISVITKRGKGIRMDKVNVVVRNEIGFQELAKYLETAQHHYYTLASDWEQYKGNYTKYSGVTYPSTYTGAGFDPGVSGARAIDADQYMDNDYGVYRNPQADFFTKGLNYTNFISLANRTEKTNVYLSFENNAQEGVIKFTDGYKRQNFRLNIDQQVASWLKLSATNLYINRTTQDPGGGGGLFYNIARMEPDANFNQANPDGQPYYLRINQFNAEQTNPIYSLWKLQRNDKTRRWLGNYSANLRFASWANFDLTYGTEIENYRYTSYNPKDTWKATGGDIGTNYMAYTGGSLYKYSSEATNQNVQFTLNLQHKFGPLAARGKLSYLYESRHFESFETSASVMGVRNIPDFSNFATISSANSYITDERAKNFFAIVGLDYKDKLLFDGMYRYDGSSLFGADARWNSYYRLSGAYRISQDVKIPGIDELKLRAAYGTAGIRPGFSWQYEYYTLTNGVAAPTQKGNTLLKPSKTAETEIGLNVNFLRKFNFEAVYARSTTTDQFLNVNLIPFLNKGFKTQYQNAGTVKSNTFEMTLGANWMRSKNFSWSSNIVFSRIRQKITELPIPAYTYTDQSMGDQYIFYVAPNETYGVMYGYRFVNSLDEMSRQLPAGKTISDYVVNSDGFVISAGTEGTPSERPIKYQENGADWYGKIGNGNPNFNMGITNTLTYKGVTLYFLLDWKNGGDIYNGKEQRLTFNYVSKLQDMAGVDPAKKKAASYYAAGLYDANNANAFWVENGSYLKLREVALGYTFTSKQLGHILNGAIREINARVVGRNLLTFTSYSGYDPEVGSIRQPYDGIYMNPNYRNLSFSLSFNF